MKIGLIGLGKMGFQIGLHLLDKGHEVKAFDVNEEAREKFGRESGAKFDSIDEMLSQLPSPKVVWVMVPAGDITTNVLNELSGKLSAEDIVIDAGNTNYKHTLKHIDLLKEKGIHLLDVGTSGGVSGARYGACFMVGGEQEVFQPLEPVFKELAVENGYLYTGKGGSGHFLKMVHNGIEYGMMAAIGEGFEVLEKSPFDYEYEDVARVWNHGSVIRSWLMELMQEAFKKDEHLDNIRGVMHSSGEGKWTVESALDFEVPTPVIALSLMMRYRSQENDTFTGKVVAALRHEFGGHAVEKK
ncbi:decarboxylating 6-phosphogluconate dehydrogenase [Radiobacillus kanasensis]|uniref:phosphogluconate dehydrogenase (NAD(+)-dependent, decarboxylating) n=1 Tax=Radiobacillus kanasensis TaxID=2844358 RepID=UPI001E603892|nr:decarboxylating 6-phosphogluconate dehydrogenase [Radiobacillus kanasensis]UFT98593.1 decarboxylating 6-phosphogluconate dehydrogenase [Radiobacillus kanasensis]